MNAVCAPPCGTKRLSPCLIGRCGYNGTCKCVIVNDSKLNECQLINRICMQV